MFLIHGVERQITVPLEAALSSDRWAATGHFTVPYARWEMKNPSTLFLRVNDSAEVDLVVAGTVVQPSTATGDPVQKPSCGAIPFPSAQS